MDTRCESFNEDNNDNFFDVCKGYFYAKKGSQVRLDSMHKMVARRLQWCSFALNEILRRLAPSIVSEK